MFSQRINVHSPISTPPREILIKEFPSRALTALSSINNKRESYATSKSNFRAPARLMINDFGRWYWWTAARELRIIAPAIGSCFQLPRIINLVMSDCAYFPSKKKRTLVPPSCPFVLLNYVLNVGARAWF